MPPSDAEPPGEQSGDGPGDPPPTEGGMGDEPSFDDDTDLTPEMDD
ncbi:MULTISPECIES: hypothetical protein [Thioalkalivibrio]|nr:MULTISPECIES: hypothetical protein [Thioalkalivibrio]